MYFDIIISKYITSLHHLLAFAACLVDTMQFLGLSFVLYLLKLSAGNGFWLFTKRDRGFELGTAEKQILRVAWWRPSTPDLRIKTPAP